MIFTDDQALLILGALRVSADEGITGFRAWSVDDYQETLRQILDAIKKQHPEMYNDERGDDLRYWERAK